MSGLTTMQSIAVENLLKRVFLAFVVDNNDPDKRQRVKVSIPQLLEAEHIEQLPWLIPMQVSDFGIGDDYGVLRVPRIGSRVLVSFQSEDLTQGIYHADLVTAATTLPAELMDNYPNRTGFSTPKGDVFFTDHQTGRVLYRHHSGSGFTIEDNGDMNFVCIGSRTDVVQGDYNLSIQGKRSVSVGGDDALQVDGNQTVVLNGNQSESVDGNYVYAGSGSRTVNCTSESRVGKINSQSDIVAEGISLSGHKHGGVDTGSGVSDGPQ